MELTVAVHFLNNAEEEQEDVLPRRRLRDMSNVLEMPTNKFVAYFRVSKDIFLMLVHKFKSHCTPSYRSTFIHEDIKLATFLRFLATGSYQQTVGNEIISSTCKASVCRIIKECLTFFESIICAEWIKIVQPEEEYMIKQAFFESTGFPGIIGCVDGTHIRIKSPGDAGYKLKPFLMTPIRNPSDVYERKFNKKHISARNVVERCFGVLKNRFRCIIGSRGLHYNPQKSTSIINTCCALHNMCIFYKCVDPKIVEENARDDEEDISDEGQIEATSIRRRIAINL